MKVLLATEKPFSAKAVDGIRQIIESAGHTMAVLEKYTNRCQLAEAVADVNAIIVRSDIIDDQIIAAAPELKIIVRAGAGYDNIDLKAATAAGIVVENTPGQNSNAVAELVFGMAIATARNGFNGTSGFELRGKTLGLQAFGQVGRNVARIARGFEMEVSAFDPFCKDEVMAEAGVNAVHSLKERFGSCG